MEPTSSSGSITTDKLLGEDDCFNILQELNPVAHRWHHIGLALGLRGNVLEKIEAKGQNDVEKLLTYTITEWLKMNYNATRFGEPTWRRIVEAVEAKSGGSNQALADSLAKKYYLRYDFWSLESFLVSHTVITQDTQPLVNSVPFSSVNTTTSPEIHTGICCCVATRVSNKHLQSDLNIMEGDDIAFGEDSVFREIGKNKIASCPPWGEVTQRSRNWSEPIQLKIDYSFDESNLIESREGSRDIIAAHPTWQIEDIAQQKGYWGTMKGAVAELRLKRHGGNCYLIRYSERQKHYVVSVMRRKTQLTAPVAHHFKLNITKEEGYEIEGTEKKFKEISGLLEFYKNNPLTPSNCTIGEACTPPSPLIR